MRVCTPSSQDNQREQVVSVKDQSTPPAFKTPQHIPQKQMLTNFESWLKSSHDSTVVTSPKQGANKAKPSKNRFKGRAFTNQKEHKCNSQKPIKFSDSVTTKVYKPYATQAIK